MRGFIRSSLLRWIICCLSSSVQLRYSLMVCSLALVSVCLVSWAKEALARCTQHMYYLQEYLQRRSVLQVVDLVCAHIRPTSRVYDLRKRPTGLDQFTVNHYIITIVSVRFCTSFGHALTKIDSKFKWSTFTLFCSQHIQQWYTILAEKQNIQASSWRQQCVQVMKCMSVYVLQICGRLLYNGKQTQGTLLPWAQTTSVCKIFMEWHVVETLHAKQTWSKEIDQFLCQLNRPSMQLAYTSAVYTCTVHVCWVWNTWTLSVKPFWAARFGLSLLKLL